MIVVLFENASQRILRGAKIGAQPSCLPKSVNQPGETPGCPTGKMPALRPFPQGVGRGCGVGRARGAGVGLGVGVGVGVTVGVGVGPAP
jgi:hypothetical protein